MESLGLPLNNLTISPQNFHKSCTRKLKQRECHYLTTSKSSSLKLKHSCTTHYQVLIQFNGYHKTSTQIRAQGGDELAQVKEMANAKKRWESLIREEKVKILTPREAGYAIQLTKKTLLDVRPSIEHKKAWVKGSSWIPIFDVENDFDAGTITKKITSFMMGGWWSGIPTLAYDNQFISKVEEKFPKDADIIVACQKGLRSLAACEQLYVAGYRNLFWIQGGLEAAEEEDLEREGPQPFKLAGIGGMSEFLGWTDQQRAAAAKEGWGYRAVFSARLIGLFLAADALYIGAQQAARYLQDVRGH